MLKTLDEKGDRFAAATTTQPARQRTGRPPRTYRCRHRIARQRHRLAGRPAGQCSTAADRHHKPAQPAGAGAREARDGLDATLGRAPENYRKLDRVRGLRQFPQLLHLCGLTIRVSDLQGRTAVFPVDQARRREVCRALMLKYRGTSTHSSRIHWSCADRFW